MAIKLNFYEIELVTTMEDSVEKTEKRKRISKILYLSFFVIVIGIVIFISRGPYVSNALKRLILPELEAASGQRVIAKNIYINIVPFFIEAKGLKVFDEDGKRVLLAKRVKGYIEPLGLLRSNLSIRRLVIKESMITTDSEKIDELVRNIRTYLGKEERKPPLKVKIKVVEVNEGAASLRDDDLKSVIKIGGLGGVVILGRDPRLKMSIKKLHINREGLPELKADIATSLVFREKEIEIEELNIGSYGSELKSSGEVSNGKGIFKTEIALLVNSLKRILNLKERGEGKISVKGEVRLGGLQSSTFLQQWKDISMDLELKGYFYLQTLMEILKVEEKVEGLVDLHGEMRGRLSDISLAAKARLQKGNLFGVDIDSLRCDITYQDGLMRFKNGNAKLYRGNARAEASIHIPDVEPFTLHVTFDSINSRGPLKLVGWNPGIPVGKVEGELTTSGSEFNPHGWFVYNHQRPKVGILSKDSTDTVLDRITNIQGTYSLRGDILSLSGLQINTSLSTLQLEGAVDMAKKTLDLTGTLDTKDVPDLTLPYYAGLKGKGNLPGEITGTFDNPEISGSIYLSNASVEGYRAYRITSHFSYSKNLLNVYEFFLMSPEEEHRLKGRISFPEAKEPFDFSGPVYEMDATVKNADLGQLTQIFYKDLPLKGRLSADFKIGGKGKDIGITGNAHADEAEVYRVPVDSASIVFSYLNKELSFQQAIVKRGSSTLKAEGKISSNEQFSFRAVSDKILLNDLGLKDMPEDSSVSLQSEGHGTFKNPDITLSAKVVGGVLEGKSLGEGTINGAIKNRNILLNASLFDGKLELKGKGHLEDTLPWTAELDIQPDSYDFIFRSVLKEMPEKLLLTLGGHIVMKGDIKNITASANINHLTLTLSGYSFSNDSDIKVQIDNRKLSLPAFAIRSGDTSLLTLRGDIEFGRKYNLFVEGRTPLAPLEKVSKRVEHLAGEADFSFSITGKWDKPEMNGEVSISNASFGVKGYRQRISAINGYATMDRDKIIVKKLSGKIGGGDINVSGFFYPDAFDIKRFYFEAQLDDVTAYPSRDVIVKLTGNLLFKGTPDSQGISGDIKIKNAKYRKKIDWKKLILSKAKEIPKADVSRFETTELNIRCYGSDNIYIDNNIARAPVTVDVVLRGTISRPILFGRLESKEGVAYFRNNEFRIIHASADFTDPNRINPFIGLKAETNVSGYDIRLDLEGQLAHFDLTLSSNPPLDKMDILALLTVGRTGKEVKGFEGGIGAGEATSFLTGELQDTIEERLSTITGIDRLQIDPYYVSKTTGTVGPRVTVSKRLVNDRLSVTYTTLLGSAEEQILKLEYLLGRNIFLLGTRDEKGITGGDIKFRFEFK